MDATRKPSNCASADTIVRERVAAAFDPGAGQQALKSYRALLRKTQAANPRKSQAAIAADVARKFPTLERAMLLASNRETVRERIESRYER